MSLGTNDIKKRNTKEFFLRNDEKLVDGKQHSVWFVPTAGLMTELP